MTVTAESERRSPLAGDAATAPMFDLIELFFFAYRDFVADADAALSAYGFGRAHHRILYFVERRAGLSIAELLEILRVTKQSLNRVLKELVAGGFVDVRPGDADRRQRRLFATAQGRDLAVRLAHLQSRRLARALAELPAEARSQASVFLHAMIDPQARSGVAGCAVPGRAHLEAVRCP